MAEPDSIPLIAQAALSSAAGDPVGTVTLSRNDGVLELNIELEGLEPSEKAFHLHTVGLCDAPDFKSAGGHLNPMDKSHGKLSDGGQHLGDFENISITANGTVSVTRTIQGNADEVLAFMFDEDGTAVMIHDGPDDYTTDPAGAAGPRIACGVLEETS
ncbi:superoxide dismutase family protein [Erythrobacter insulae]|uniref:superoxide dismutase family protein n=1 Tax=Erythrobacter insulae TaxID=2584124 RepID=UPI001F3DF8BB|nr:superoxide dismutase family protein [Erythrobacter insulae]